MPLIIAIAVRYIIMAAVQLGLYSLAEKYAIPLLNKCIEEIIQFFGVSEDTAQDIMANEILQGAEAVGIFAITLKTKLPLKVTDQLGFTTKGWVKRKLTSSVEAKIIAAKAGQAISGIANAQSAEKIAQAVAPALKIQIPTTVKVLAGLYAFIQLTNGIAYMMAQYIDYGNWNGGAYQGTFQKFLSYFGLEPDKRLAKATQVSPEMWSKIYNFYKIRGAVGIVDPTGDSDYPFNAENLAKVVDRIAAAIIADEGTPTFKNVLGATQAMIVFQTGNPVEPVTLPSFVTTGTSTPSATKPPVNIKIFTGVVADGALGAAVAFTERPDDMITSVEEIKDAAKNNLTAFVASLPGTFYYEIAIVNSVRTRGGFTQKGQAVRIVSGYDKDGSARYKTIYNKFAVMRVGVTDQAGRTVKLREIVLGPTDASSFQPTGVQLADVAKTITPELFTSNVGEVKSIVTSSAVTVTPPPLSTPQPVTYVPPPAQPAGAAASPIVSPLTPTPVAPVVAPPPPVTPPPPPQALSAQQIALKAATNLSEAYAAIGGSLPPLNTRAYLYEKWGLGQAALYAGTAEQNAKYLAELKSQFGLR